MSQDQALITPSWPDAGGRRVIFLLDASSPTEERVLRQWISQNAPSPDAASLVETVMLPPSRRRKKKAPLDPQFEVILRTDDDPLLAPLRIAWLPKKVDGKRRVRIKDLLIFRDPRDPGPLRELWELKVHPDRCRIVVGQPAPLSNLRMRWTQSSEANTAPTRGLPDFVCLQAGLALERAERQLRGMRYKVPRFVRQDILQSPPFLSGISKLCREHSLNESKAIQDAGVYLKEIAAVHSPYVIDLSAHLIRILYTQGYGESLHYDREELARIYSLAQKRPIVFLPSHKSNLDHLVLQYALYENGHPPNHAAGGINMNFFPIGPIIRRSGIFFIRRSFRDNHVYKFVVRQYIDYLIENRFGLEWYIEGGRSRSGKLLPARFGLLSYVVDAWRRGMSEDVILVPVSIAYDQIQEVAAYADEQSGGEKQKESLGWFIRVVSALRSRYGDIHIRFGEPISLRDTLGSPELLAKPERETQALPVQKLGFELSLRINQVTPITPISLTTLALLGVEDRALTVEEVRAELQDIYSYVKKRNLPTTVALNLESAATVRQILRSLVESGLVNCFSEGPEDVYAIEADAYLSAAYYRNTIIHFFLAGAIVELALLGAARHAEGDATAAFWNEVRTLRDLLKFEFFFAEKQDFQEEIRQELALYSPDWEEQLREGASGVRAIIREISPLKAHRVLRPFIAAYRIVGDALERRDPQAKFDEDKFLSSCLSLGKQYRLQQRIRSSESLSKVLFATALSLARNRKLLEMDAPGLEDERHVFASEIRDILHRADAIQALAISRRAGLID